MTEKEALAVARTRVAELRDTFDQTFARAIRPAEDDLEGLLALRVGSEQVVVRLSEVRALLPAPRIVPLPSQAPNLLGLAGVRGSVVPIYGLGALLGQPASSGPFQAVVLVGAEAPLGLACDGLAGYLRLPRSEISSAVSPAPDGAPRSHVAEMVRIDGVLRAIVSVASVLRVLEQQLGGKPVGIKEA